MNNRRNIPFLRSVESMETQWIAFFSRFVRWELRLLSANDPNRIQIILVGKFEGAWRWHCSRRLSPPVLPVNFVGYEYSVSTWIDRISPNVFSSRNNFNNFPEFRWSAIGESPWTRRTADPHRPVLTINFRVHVLGPIGGFSCQIIIGLRKCHKI